MDGMSDASDDALQNEFKADLNAYLASTRPDQVSTRTLADLIAFDAAKADKEMPLFGQDIFLKAQAKAGLDNPAYQAARAKSLRLGLVRGLPVGLSFIAGASAEQRLLDAGFAYEQTAGLQLRPDFRPPVDEGQALEGAR